MKRKWNQKRTINDEKISIPSGIIPNKKLAPANQINPPVFDFSKRSHQAAFWMLLNTIIYDRSSDSTDIFREMGL